MFYILMPERCLRRPPVDSGRVHPSPPLEKNVSEIGSPCSRESSDSRDPGRFRSENPFCPPRKNFFSECVLHVKGNIFFFASVTAKKILRPPASPDKIALLPPSKKNFFLKYVLHVKGNIFFFFR